MTRKEAVAVLEAFIENPLFSNTHKAAFNIAIHDIKQRHDWDINNLILIKNGTPHDDVLDKIRAIIIEEKECAYADFDKYKVDYLGVDSRYVEDELPDDDFRYGMERCIDIIDQYRNEVSE